MAPPFKEAEFDIMYGEGISREGEILDLAVKLEIIQKSGAWFSYKDNRLAQGRDNTKTAIRDNPELMKELEQLVRENVGKLNPTGRSVSVLRQPTEIPIEAAARVSSGTAKANIDISVDD